MNKNARLLVPAAAFLAGLGVAMAPVAAADQQDDAFLQALDQNGVSFPNLSNSGVASMGHGVCKDWMDGATFSQIISDVQGTTQLSAHGTGVFIGAATGAFCSQYLSKVPSD
jgi:hypothetical protein